MSTSLYKQRVKDVMSRDVVTIDARYSVHDTLQLMSDNRVATLPVVDGNLRCIGVISASDLMDVTAAIDYEIEELDRKGHYFFGHMIERLGDGLGHHSVMDMMSENVVSIGPEELLTEAASRMLRDRIHRLPVVADERVVGIVSTTDVLMAFVDSTEAMVSK